MEIKSAEYTRSCVKELDYPEKYDKVEMAFVGRSNVGKSSLINSLVINNDRYFVDLPGYGFAKVPSNIKKNWGNLIEEYLKSDRKKVVFVLLDIRRVPSGEDMEMLKYLEHYDIEYYIIFTKSDKLSNNEKFRQLKEIKKKLVFDNEDVFFHSSLKNTGREEILDFIESIK